jgi:hypothetical protein
VRVDVKTLVVPEGGELPPEAEPADVEASEEQAPETSEVLTAETEAAEEQVPADVFDVAVDAGDAEVEEDPA